MDSGVKERRKKEEKKGMGCGERQKPYRRYSPVAYCLAAVYCVASIEKKKGKKKKGKKKKTE